MIFAIGKFGLLNARFAIYGNDKHGPPAKGRQRKEATHGPDCGQPVWLTIDEAQAAVNFLNVRDKIIFHKNQIPGNAWIVVGVDADWEKDTDIMADPQFTTANQLIRPCPLIELQMEFPI